MPEQVAEYIMYGILVLGILLVPVGFLVYAHYVGENSQTQPMPIDADSKIEVARRVGQASRGEIR